MFPSNAEPQGWIGGEIGRYLSEFRAIARQSRRSATLLSTGIVLVIGFVDWMSGWEISWSVIYVFPIAIAVWYVGPGLGYALSFLSVGLWVTGDFADGLQVSSWLVPVWNAVIRLIFYDIYIRMLVYIRSQAKILENKVAQRTADLRTEIAERTRLERELLAAGERERQRLGYDLHDGLGQHLTGTALFLQVLKEKLARRGLPESDEAAKAVTLIEQGIELSHQLAKGLQPIDMQAGGLMQALQDFANATENLFNISCRFECDSPVLVPDVGTADHLYRIVQEATSNAIKHGRATLVIISLEAADDGTFLEIADNGSGLPKRRPDAGGMGMRIMEQRAKLIGGRISFKPREGGGTVVTCVLQSNADYEQSRVVEEA